ncbi:MarR family transcriptional regulator [Lederbergia sp. NSJ-179]|uniref:MarR family winged helix-turn-helix transcriptional regulator n=1 Tax=Lederbergia sp. NSJ-179 TaxID=2931402 RepID=UPI001FD58FA1|nr:MarR family transcriptional regulator [Lederbergia sp. NSJ-179]MCJ7841453.1 MarR family transcriptional regulator [Lederbergia sp. NSJ-179]
MELKELVDRYQAAMNSVYRGVNQILKEKIDPEITTDQFSTLQYIRNNGRCTSTEIAQKFGIGKSAVTAQINKLYDKGFIERKRDEKDRRIVYLNLTQTGKELVELSETKLYPEIYKQLAHFNIEDIQKFIGLLEELAKLMEERVEGRYS